MDPAFSPNGKLIAYDYRKPGFSIREIYVMNADGTGIRQVTHLNHVSSLPAWSPDGKTLAFQSNSLGHFEIYTAALDGTHVQPGDDVRDGRDPAGLGPGRDQDRVRAGRRDLDRWAAERTRS